MATSRLLLDNWTLQDAGAVLGGVLGGGTTHEIVFSPDRQSFRYAEVSESVVALECLFLLLHNLVFADEILVDADFTSSWQEHSSIAALARDHVVKPKPLIAAKAEWVECREAMVEQLSFCPEVRHRHQQNTESYSATRQTVDRMLSQVLWGGAGMLARANFLRVPYVPHPLRRRLFVRAEVLLGPTDANSQLKSFVEARRSKLFERIDASGFFAELRVPPVVVEIVEMASTLDDLVPAALELRSAYRELRGWIGELQTALDQDDVQAVLSRRKMLESVSRHIDQLCRAVPSGEGSIRLGVSWLNVTKNIGSPINSLQNRFGVRAQINRLVLAPAGRNALKKVLGLLGEQNQHSLLLKGFAAAQDWE